MHKIHHTDGFIIESIDSGEANRFLWIYTKEFGLIGAHAQGVRLMKSKLRYTIHDMAYCSVSLVRGRDIWRVTSATRINAPIENIIRDNGKRLVFSRILKLLRSLVNGEERDDRLFDALHRSYVLLQDKSVGENLVKNIEIIVVMQVLHILGYLSLPQEYLGFIESDSWSMEVLESVGKSEKAIVGLINRSIESIDM